MSFQKTVFELEHSDLLGTGADYFNFSFGCAQEPKDGKIRLVNSHHTCREGLMSNMRDRINSESSAQPTDKMRMIFRFCAGTQNIKANLELADSWIKRSVPVLQAFDKLAGWPLTRAYKIEIPKQHEDWLRAYYFWSSRRWMKSSYLVSLYTLLVRMCKDERITGFKDFDGLVKVMEKIFKSDKNLKSDHAYVKSSMPYWKAIMLGYPDLFRARKMTYYWDTSHVNGRTGSEGVQYLVSGDTNYTAIRSELLRIKKELEAGTYKPKEPKKKKEAS